MLERSGLAARNHCGRVSLPDATKRQVSQSVAAFRSAVKGPVLLFESGWIIWPLRTTDQFGHGTSMRQSEYSLQYRSVFFLSGGVRSV